MKVGEQVRPFQPLPRRAPPDPPAARESVWASRVCLLYLPRRRSNCGRVADALGTPLQTLAELRKMGVGAEEALRTVHRQEQQALEDALGERLRAEVRPSTHLRSLKIEQRSLTRAKKFAEAMELMKMTEGLAREEADDHRERVRRAHMSDLQQLFDRQAEERLVLQQKMQVEEEEARRRMAQGTSPRAFVHSPSRRGVFAEPSERRRGGSRRGGARGKASARAKEDSEGGERMKENLTLGGKKAPVRSEVSRANERRADAEAAALSTSSARRASQEPWELYKDMSWKSPSTEWEAAPGAKKAAQRLETPAERSRKRFGLPIQTSDEGAALLSPSEMLAAGLSSVDGRVWSPKPTEGPRRKAKAKPRPGLVMPSEPTYASPRTRSRQKVKSTKQTEFDKVMDAVARLASGSPSPPPRAKRKVKAQTVRSKPEYLPRSGASSQRARTPKARSARSTSSTEGLSKESWGDTLDESLRYSRDLISSPAPAPPPKKKAASAKGAKKRKVKKKGSTSGRTGGSGAGVPSYMRPTKAKTARSFGTAKDSEDISADLELDLDPWDDDVISSFRNGLSITQRTDDQYLQHSTGREGQSHSLGETVTPSPRPDGVRPSFWEETSPREVSRTERNLCLSPPSDSASPSDVEFGGLVFKDAEKSHWNGGHDFLQSSTEAAQRTNHEISQRHALDRAMDLVLERAAHRPNGLAEGELGRLPPSSNVDSHGRTERVLLPAPNNSNGQNVFHPAEAGASGQGAPLANTAGLPHAPAPAQSFVQTGAPVAYHAGGFPGSYVGGLPVGGQYAPVMVYGAPSYGVPHGGMNPAGLVYAPPPPAAGSAGELAGRGSQEAPEGVARSRVAPQGPDSDALNARPDGHIKGAPGGSTGASVPAPAQTITQPRIPATGSPRGKKTSQVGAGAAAVGGVGGKDRGRASGPTTEAKPVAPTRTALTVAPGDELHRGSAAGKAQAESSDSDDFDENDFDLVSPVAGRSLTSHSVPGLRVTSRVPLAPTGMHGPRPKPRSPKSQASPPPSAPRLVVAEAAAPPKAAGLDRQRRQAPPLSLAVPGLRNELAALSDDLRQGAEKAPRQVAPAQRAAAAAAALAAAKHWSAPPAPLTGALGTPFKFRRPDDATSADAPGTPSQPVVKEGPGERASAEASPARAKSEGFALEDIGVLFTHLRHGRYSEARALIKQGAPVDCRDRGGNTPLMAACQNGRGKLVKLCIRHGANVNAQNKQGNTALHFALAFQFQAIGEFLVAKGADDGILNLKGLTCYEGLGKD